MLCNFIIINASDIPLYEFNYIKNDDSSKIDTQESTIFACFVEPGSPVLGINSRPITADEAQNEPEEPDLSCCSVLTQTVPLFKKDMRSLCSIDEYIKCIDLTCCQCNNQCLDQYLGEPAHLPHQVAQCRKCYRSAFASTCIASCIICPTALLAIFYL